MALELKMVFTFVKFEENKKNKEDYAAEIFTIWPLQKIIVINPCSCFMMTHNLSVLFTTIIELEILPKHKRHIIHICVKEGREKL